MACQGGKKSRLDGQPADGPGIAGELEGSTASGNGKMCGCRRAAMAAAAATATAVVEVAARA